MNGWHTLAERQYGVITDAASRGGRDGSQDHTPLGAGSSASTPDASGPGLVAQPRQREDSGSPLVRRRALLSHETGASLLRLPVVASEVVHVTVPGSRRRTACRGRRAPNRVSRSRDRVIVDGLPCTSGTRTVIDLATMLQGEDLERVLRDRQGGTG